MWAFFGVEISFIVKVVFYSKPANLEIVFFKTAMRSLYCDKSLDTNNFWSGRICSTPNDLVTKSINLSAAAKVLLRKAIKIPLAPASTFDTLAA